MSILDRFKLEIKAPQRPRPRKPQEIEWLSANVPPEAELRFYQGDRREEIVQRNALTLPAVFSSANNVAKMAASYVPEIVRQAGPDQEAEPIKGHEFERVMWEPNKWMSRTFLFWFTYLALPLRGNAYWYLADDREGGPVEELWPIPPFRVTPVPAKDTSVFVSHYNYRADRQAEPIRIPTENVVWFRQPNLFDLVDGLSSVAPLAENVETARNQRTYRGRFFGPMNARPTSAIGIKKDVSPAQFEELKEEILRELNIMNRSTMVHRAGDVDVKLFGMTAEDLGLLDFDEADARVFKEVLGWSEALGAKDTTYASMYAAQDVVTEYSVWPYLQLVAGDISAQALMPRYGEDVKARYKDIRPKRRSEDRADYGIYSLERTINENREARGLKPVNLADAEEEVEIAGMPLVEICERVPVRLLEFALKQQAPAFPNPFAGQEPREPPGREEVKAELEKWERKALRVFGENGNAAEFESDVIPPALHAHVAAGLKVAASEKDVKAVFQEVTAGRFFRGSGGWGYP